MRSLGMILAMQSRERCGHRDRDKGPKSFQETHGLLLDGIFRPFPSLSLVMYRDTLLAQEPGSASESAYKNSIVKFKPTLRVCCKTVQISGRPMG